jgi:GNAT superfamily N-acetyltransferase
MLTLRQVTCADTSLLEGLVQLLIDVVDGGASVGFHDPLSPATARRYWEQVLASLGDGLAMWVALIDERVVGSVQLAPCLKDNGRHRADLQKLQVMSACRGQGISSRLMDAAEAFARREGRTLLVLDTLAGSDAEFIYRHRGWNKVGEIPCYASDAQGRLHATAYYYKLLVEG